MELGRKRLFRGNMKAIHKYLNRCCKKEERNHSDLLREDKTRSNGGSCRADSQFAIKRRSGRPSWSRQTMTSSSFHTNKYNLDN